jgi:hypothetical protein
MNEYKIQVTHTATPLRCFAKCVADAKKEAEEAGHKVLSVSLIREDVPIAAGVVCRCDEPGVKTCPMHGRRR